MRGNGDLRARLAGRLVLCEEALGGVTNVAGEVRDAETVGEASRRLERGGGSVVRPQLLEHRSVGAGAE